ncbi:metal-sensing transcriptional repressor [Dialister invisus]
MVEEDIACEDMLSQINAAKSALHRVGQIVLEGHPPSLRFRWN